MPLYSINILKIISLGGGGGYNAPSTGYNAGGGSGYNAPSIPAPGKSS